MRPPAWFREGKLMTSSVALAHKGVPRLPTGIPQERRELTWRERQIVVLASAGMSAPEIGRRLGMLASALVLFGQEVTAWPCHASNWMP